MHSSPSTLFTVSDRIATVVTELNGLSSSILNDEMTLADFDNDLSILLPKLVEAEAAVSRLTEEFYRR